MKWNTVEILKAMFIDEYLLMWKIFMKELKKQEVTTYCVMWYLIGKTRTYMHIYSYIRNTYACIYTHNGKHLK